MESGHGLAAGPGIFRLRGYAAPLKMTVRRAAAYGAQARGWGRAAAAQIQKVYQSTLNEGFRGMFILVAACSAFGLVVLMGYKDTAPAAQRRRQRRQQAQD